MNTLLTWMTRQAITIICTCGGVFLGLCLAAPLLHWQLPDVVAELMGGALGAIASVAGAMFVLKRQMMYAEEEKAAAQVEYRKKLTRQFSLVFVSAAHVFKSEDGHGRRLTMVESQPQFDQLEQDICNLIKQLNGDVPLRAALDSRGTEVLLLSLVALDAILGRIRELRACMTDVIAGRPSINFNPLWTSLIKTFNLFIRDLAAAATEPDVLKYKLAVTQPINVVFPATPHTSSGN